MMTPDLVHESDRSLATALDPDGAGRDAGHHATFELQNASKSYDGRAVLSIDRLQIRKGETLAIVGPSGAGKTTLLKLLALVDRPSAGCVRFLGRRTDGLNTPLAWRRRIVMVFQRPLLLGRSVAENVAFGLYLRQAAESTTRTQELIRDLGLQGLDRRLATTLSGGEQQRVALARALAVDPEVLLLDEPTAHLDPAHVARVERRLARLAGERKTTIVLATHNVFQARRLADRVALLLDGRLVELAETSRFFDSPADPRTAAFLRGDMVY